MTTYALAGLAEAAVILGVSKQRAHQLAKKPSCPVPIAVLGCGPIWQENQIRVYAKRRSVMLERLRELQS